MTSLRLLVPVLLVVLTTACTVMDMEDPNDGSDPFTQTWPEYPNSEFMRFREGWVIVGYVVGRGGIVEDFYIMESSGNEAFNEAATNAIREWRYSPGTEERESTVLVSFIDSPDGVKLSRDFSVVHEEANALIVQGELDRAGELLAELREDEGLHPSELAYSHLVEARIAAVRGDRETQLRHIRKAMIGSGWWLAHEHYLEALHIAVVLEFDQDDLASAIRDYAILAHSGPDGMERAADVEELVKAAQVRVNADPIVRAPYVDAEEFLVVRPSVATSSRKKGAQYGSGVNRPSATSGSAQSGNRPSGRSGARGGGGGARQGD